MNKMSIDLKVGEVLTIGGATVLLVKKSGQLARLVVTAEANTTITPPYAARKSVLQPENLEHQNG